MARDKIKTIRQLRKLSQGALAKAAGLTVSEMSRIECGYRDMNGREAVAIAKALGVSLVTISDQPETLVPAAAVGLAAAKLAPSPATTVVAPATTNATPATTLVASAAVPREVSAPAVINSNLDDPTNFNELPDLTLLDTGALDSAAFRARLSPALARAGKVLHTSRVPAATWRAWREFERKIQDLLRDPSAAS